MNRKFFSIVGITLSIGILVTGVYASKSLSETPEETNSEMMQIQNALDNSDVLKSRYDIVSDEDNDQINNSDIQMQSMENETMHAADAIKIYKVCLSDTVNKLSGQLDKENELWMLPKVIDNEIMFVFMKKGENIENATEKIMALNIDTKRKEKMIDTARKRAEKWFVHRIESQQSMAYAENFVNIEHIMDIINMENISDVSDIRYVYITNNNMLAVWVQKDDTEYIIPYVANGKTKHLENDKLYTLSEVTAEILNNNE